MKFSYALAMAFILGEVGVSPASYADETEELTFPRGSAQINPEAKQSLAKIAQALAGDSDKKICIEGFTDSSGSELLNQKLAEARAEAVKNILIQNGIKESQLSIIPYGNEFPAASNATPEGRADNRRVEIHLTG